MQRAPAGAAVQRATRILLARQDSRGRWSGRSAGDVTIDAEVELIREFLSLRTAEVTSAAAQQIRSVQQPDGSWIARPSRTGPEICPRRCLPTWLCVSPATRPMLTISPLGPGWIRDAGGWAAAGLVTRAGSPASGSSGGQMRAFPLLKVFISWPRFSPTGGRRGGKLGPGGRGVAERSSRRCARPGHCR